MAALTESAFPTARSQFPLRHTALKRQATGARSPHRQRQSIRPAASAQNFDGISEGASWSDRTILGIISLMTVLAAGMWTAIGMCLWRLLAG
jgi:hypothetical protein